MKMEYGITYPGKTLSEDVIRHTRPARLKEVFPAGCATSAKGRGAKEWQNMLIRGDNLGVLKALLEMKEEGKIKNADSSAGVRLVYIDPPFSTRLGFKAADDKKAYDDKITGAAFIDFLRKRLLFLRELLSDDGTVYVHLDWKKAHYVKAVMDEVFGEENFLNDIIWHYGGRGAKAVSGQFSRNHDIILWYKKGREHLFNRAFIEKRVRKGEGGFRQDEQGRWFKTAPRGDYTGRSIAALFRDGRVHTTKNGNIRIKYLLREDGDYLVEDKLVGDVWDDIPDAMHMPLREKTGYPTQKPEALLARIIAASSKDGDVVLDAFAGSGTTLAVAGKMGRRWIGIDAGEMAAKTARKRLLRDAAQKGAGKRCGKQHAPFAFFRAGKYK